MFDFKELVSQLSKPIILLILLIISGTTGFTAIEGWDTLDSLYMTLITLTTVGFGEVHSLSGGGKVFTMLLLLGGVIFYATAINGIARGLIETSLSDRVNEYRMLRKIQKMKNHYIICGGGRMALAIGEELERAGNDFVFIEKNHESIVSEHKERWPILVKDALLEEALIEAGIEEAQGLAAVLPTDADNLFVVLSARKLNTDLYIQTRIALESTRPKMIQAGANKVVSPYNAGGVQIARTFVNPEVDDFLSVVTDRASYEFEMKIHTVAHEDSFCNRSLRDSEFRSQGYTVIGVRYEDGRMVFAPDAKFTLRQGQQIFLMGPGSEPPGEPKPA